MAKVECFDAEGKMYMKEPVDARECVEHCGFTMSKPEATISIEVVSPLNAEAKPSKGRKG